MTATRTPEAPLTPLSQGYVTFDTPFATATLAIGSLPFGQSVSLPLGSDPSLALHFNIPTDRPPEVQYQRLMELAQAFQFMALSARPPLAPSAPEVPLHPPPAFHAFHTAPLPRLSP